MLKCYKDENSHTFLGAWICHHILKIHNGDSRFFHIPHFKLFAQERNFSHDFSSTVSISSTHTKFNTR